MLLGKHATSWSFRLQSAPLGALKLFEQFSRDDDPFAPLRMASRFLYVAFKGAE